MHGYHHKKNKNENKKEEKLAPGNDGGAGQHKTVAKKVGKKKENKNWHQAMRT